VYGFKKRCGRETDKQEDYEFTISRKLLNILKERCKGKDFLEISGDAEKEFDKLKGEKFGLSSRDDLSNWYAAIGQLVHPKRGALNIWMAGVIDTGKGQPQE
jgi:hypothetical protein